MVNAAVMTGPNQRGSEKTKAPVIVIPFNRAAIEHEEQFADNTLLLTANTQQVGPIDVPAYGYMRHIKMEVTASAGAGTAVGQPDAPFVILQDVALVDVNGQPIVGPFTGYDLYLVNKYGGYKKLADPKQKPSYSAPSGTGGNFRFALRLPVEISNRDALGALANMNSSATYKLRYSLAPSAVVYSTLPTTLPSIRVRCWLEAWSQPAQTDAQNRAQSTVPPAHGTTQYWSKTSLAVVNGFNTLRLPRVGNYLRELIFIYRDAAGVRSTVAASFPDTPGLNWDTRPLFQRGQTQWQDQIADRLDLRNAIETAGGLDTSVYVEDYAHDFDGRVGEELRDGWLPTAQSSRLELQGTFGAAGTLTILTNDVAPAGEVFL